MRTKTSVLWLWPHELFSALYQFHPAAFAKYILGGGPRHLQQFWRMMPARSGIQDIAGWQRWFVPLGLHGDGVSVSNIRGAGSKCVDTLSWTSLLSSAPTRFSTYFCFKHLAKPTGLAATWASFWRKLALSFRILFSGLWPARTVEGEPEPRKGQYLAGGYRGVLYINKGDLDWMAGHFKLPHAASKYPCGLCQCSNLGSGVDTFPWTDPNNRPSWETTCWTDEAHRRGLFWNVTLFL